MKFGEPNGRLAASRSIVWCSCSQHSLVQTQGDYHANCFLGIGAPITNPDAIHFNDAWLTLAGFVDGASDWMSAQKHLLR